MNTGAVEEVFLKTGELYFGGGAVRVRTVLGTCIAIVLWHPKLRIGGMCHYLLPTRMPDRSRKAGPEGMYAEEVMRLFASRLARTGTEASEYIVKLFGGGNMFAGTLEERGCPLNPCLAPARSACPSVGCKNVKAARELLAVHGFRIGAEHVGGFGSRNLIFELWSGDVWVKQGEPLSPTRPTA